MPEKPHAEEAEEGNLPIHDEKDIGDTKWEQSIPTAPEEIPEEVRIESEATEPVRVLTPEQPTQNSEEAPQKKDPGTSHGPECSKKVVVPSNKTLEIRELREEQWRLLSIIAHLHQ